jgi:broad specificity phosphatase PhoE
MVPLVLIRHGPTDWNRERRIQGRSDRPLDPEGVAALRRLVLPQAWAGYDWVTSPLARARQTAAVLGHPEAAVEPALIEMDWGEWEGRRLAELRADPGAEMARREGAGLDFAAPGGESPRQVQARLAPWLGRLAAAGRPTVAVGHKGVMRALYALATGWDMTGEAPDRLRPYRAFGFLVDAAGSPCLPRDGRLHVL